MKWKAAFLLVCVAFLAVPANGVFSSALWNWVSSVTERFLHPRVHPHRLRPGHRWDPFLPVRPDLLFEAELAASDDIISLMEERLSDTAGNMKDMNSSELLPLLPYDIAWMIEETKVRMGKFKPELTETMARLTSVSYCDFQNIQAWNCSRCNASVSGFEVTKMVYDEGWDLFAFAGHFPALDANVVVFRGTDSRSIYNWVENMRYWRSDFHLPFPGAQGAMVHTGFFASYNQSSLAPNITEAVQALQRAHPGRPLYVVGHSMGAAMATVCAVSLRYLLNIYDIRVYTFGSPRVGNSVFADLVKNQFKEVYRVTHNRDIVPSVPFGYLGFHHVATEVFEIEFGDPGNQVIGICDGSGEDPNCHNKMCYLGLCTSIADHLSYLGADMYHSNPKGC